MTHLADAAGGTPPLPPRRLAFFERYLTDGDPAYTLVQVAVNDLIMLVAFAPIVMFLCGVAQVVVPSRVLITSVAWTATNTGSP